MSKNHTINDLIIVNDIVEKQQYVQSGGLPAVIARIGEFLLIIVVYILKALKNLFMKLFRFRPKYHLIFHLFLQQMQEKLFSLNFVG